MLRLLRRAMLAFAAYAGVLFAVVIAGFLGGAVGLWAAAAWGAVVIAVAVVYGRKRLGNF